MCEKLSQLKQTKAFRKTTYVAVFQKTTLQWIFYKKEQICKYKEKIYRGKTIPRTLWTRKVDLYCGNSTPTSSHSIISSVVQRRSKQPLQKSTNHKWIKENKNAFGNQKTKHQNLFLPQTKCSWLVNLGTFCIYPSTPQIIHSYKFIVVMMEDFLPLIHSIFFRYF